ncbi:MAG: signal peptidase I [Cyanobacteria bacterium P01_A01_bin.123]
MTSEQNNTVEQDGALASPSPADETTVAPLPLWQRLWQQHRENIKVLAIALVIAIVMRLWVAEPRFIPSDSMEPTLHIGDRLIIEKLAYWLDSPQRGDVVVFEPPPQLQAQGYRRQQAFIKRVIAQPGETVAVHQGQVYIDGEPLAEPYVLEAPRYELLPVQVPPDTLFVMGDNRNNSNDSHVWGFLPIQNVIGHALYRFWPLDTISSL